MMHIQSIHISFLTNVKLTYKTFIMSYYYKKPTWKIINDINYLAKNDNLSFKKNCKPLKMYKKPTPFLFLYKDVGYVYKPMLFLILSPKILVFFLNKQLMSN